jgi:hypothetical protein
LFTIVSKTLKMKNVFIGFALLFILVCKAQTKLISHKSHSGNNYNFRISVEKNLFDIDEYNLGEMPIRTETYNTLDTVICLSKTKIIRITSEYTQRYNKRNNKKYTVAELVKIRKDTFEIVPKSKKRLTIAQVKQTFDSLKIYKNNTDSTVFSGFDKKSKKTKKKGFIFPSTINKPNFPSKEFSEFVFFGLVILISIFGLKIYNARKFVL